MFRRYFLPPLVWIFYRLLVSSWRLNIIESPSMAAARNAGRPLIFAHWHGDELAITHLVKSYRIATMTSTSRDGALIDFVIRRLGGATSRGSSTRGAVGALKGLIRLMRNGYNASMAVDGPKGPLHKVKPGVFELSRLANAAIVPMGAATRSRILFARSWNQTYLPKPFARVTVFFSEPWPPIIDEDPKDSRISAKLEADIAKACHAAHAHLT